MVWNTVVFMFTPIWGRCSNLISYFFRWVEATNQKRSRHIFFSGVLTAAHWGSDQQSSGEVVEACSIVTSKWSRGYPPPKNDMTSWKIDHDPPWRCISYWKWWFSNVMLFFRGVRDFRSSQEKTCNHHWIYFHKPSWHVDIPKSNLSTLYFFSDIYIYIHIKLFWGVKVQTEGRSSHVFWSVFVSSSLEFVRLGIRNQRISRLVRPSWFLANIYIRG